MSTFELAQAVAVLERTPSALSALLRGLPEAWSRAREGADGWSPYDVVGHLVHGERTDWLARARIILEHGESRPFDPFDRLAMFRESEGKSLEDLLAEFAELRRENLAALRQLDLGAPDLARAGTHPDFGRVTLEQLLATWAVHDLNHLGQIVRAMAKRYRDAVGPWAVYLPLLRDREQGAGGGRA